MMKRMKKAMSIALAAVLLVVLAVPFGTPVYAGVSAPILVSGNDITITRGDTAPSVLDNTEFGEVTGTVVKEFKIRRAAAMSEPFQFSGDPIVQITGENASDFTVTQQPASSLATQGAITSFTISFQPAASGTKMKTATVTITYNYNSNPGNYTFSIQGTKLYGGGIGTEADPYLISTAADLKQLAEIVNAGEHYNGTYFKMTNDIALNSDTSNYENWNTAPPAVTWSAIGCSSSNYFSGNFNGNNHEVSGICVTGAGIHYGGLFGYGKGCTIENLGIVESMIAADRYTGAVIGSIEYIGTSTAAIKNCYNEGIVCGVAFAGGIAGLLNSQNESPIIISGCDNRGDVRAFRTASQTSEVYAGGIAGGISSGEFGFPERTGDVVMQNCRNYGVVSGDDCIGGIAGVTANKAESSTLIVNSCKNHGAVSLIRDVTGYGNGDGFLGGIAGRNMKGLVMNCGSTGDLSMEAENARHQHVGGLFGENGVSDACVLNNYSTSDIMVTCTTTNAIYIGGIAGIARRDDVVNNYYAGNIYTILNDVNAEYIGYIFGKTTDINSSVYVTKNYYDNTRTTAIAFGASDGMAEGIPPAAMKLTSGDDALLTKLNNGTTSVSAILTAKGLTTASAFMVSNGYSGAAPSAWLIQSSLNDGYPQFDTASSGGGGGGRKSLPATQQIEVNGDPVEAAFAKGEEKGRSLTTVTLDEKKLKEKLDKSGAKPTVAIPVDNGSDIVRGELNGQMVRDMEKKDAVLEIKTGSIQYVLPAAQINIDAISGQVGTQVALSDIKVQIQIASSTEDTVKAVEDAANKGSFTLVVPPVEFDIKCTYGDRTVNVSRFNNYVERTVAIPAGVDPSKITTGVVLDPDGTVHHVPTKIIAIAGKYYAKINSLTNSVYSVVWNPVTFADVANHWAKAAVNDMGSRMIIGGIGNGKFEPNRDITRAEFAAIVVRALGLAPGEGDNKFADVSETSWYAGYVKTAVSYGLITGISDTSFGPNSKITREQAMSMVARAMKLTKLASDPDDAQIQSLLSAYGDTDKVSGYAKQGIAECLKARVVSGRSENTIAPKANMTRAEVAAVIQRLLQKSELI